MTIACQRFLVRIYDEENITAEEFAETRLKDFNHVVLKGDSSLEDEAEIAGMGDETPSS